MVFDRSVTVTILAAREAERFDGRGAARFDERGKPIAIEHEPAAVLIVGGHSPRDSWGEVGAI